MERSDFLLYRNPVLIAKTTRSILLRNPGGFATQMKQDTNTN